MAWRLATSPTSTSPVFENATTDGVVRAPSELGMTAGSPASRVDTTELVVPRSIPTALLIRDVLRDLSPLVSTYVSQPTASPVNSPPLRFLPTQPAGRRTQPRRGPEVRDRQRRAPTAKPRGRRRSIGAGEFGQTRRSRGALMSESAVDAAGGDPGHQHAASLTLGLGSSRGSAASRCVHRPSG